MSSLRTLAITAVCAVSLVCAASAQATVGPAGNGEPPTTSSTTNTWHFAYTTVSTGYQMCFKLYRDGVLIRDFGGWPTGGHPAPGAGDGLCTGVMTGDRTSTIPFTQAGLQNGSRYEVCSFSFENYGDGTWFMRVKSFDSCSATTIDTGKPALTTWVGGEAQYTNNPIIPVHMQYQDALSHPWSQNRGVANAKAATIGCLTRGDSCTPNEYAEGCSTPNTGRFSSSPGFKTNSFDCAYDFTPYEDGRVTFCATQTDWALADKPNTTDQFSNQNSGTANTSPAACGNVILDRGGPALDAGPDLTVKTGDLVTLDASASDALSGVGQIDWTFGDNTPGAAGPTATHTYTQPGTYIVKASTKDGAGNTGEDTVTVTVEPIPTGGSTGTGGGTGGATATGGGGTTVQTITPSQGRDVISKEGGSGAATVDVAGLDVSAPRTLKLKASTRRLPVVLDADRPGAASLALVKGARIVAKGGVTIGQGGTYVVKMKLPKGLKAGKYSLRVSFTPQGATKATSKRLAVTIRSAKAKAKAKARAAAVPVVGPAADEDVTTVGPKRTR